MLTKLWRFLFGGCEHKWKQFHVAKVYVQDPLTGKDRDRPSEIRFLMQCEKCGETKKVVI